MVCKKCNKEIDELEVYCEECKLKQQKELEQLQEENKKLNKLENTKEVITLEKLNEEKTDDDTIKEELKDIVKIDEDEIKIDNDKNIILIVLSVIIILLIFVTIYIVLISKKEESKEEIEQPFVDYREILNNYGKKVEEVVFKYLKENKEVPSWGTVNNDVDFDEHEIFCNIQYIYEDGNIYLDECIVDKVSISYSYGIKQDQEKKGMEINIYKKDGENVNYSSEKTNESILVGTINCLKETCEYVTAFDKYTLINENEKLYIYNYENNTIEFGPFEYNDYNIISYENILYGILYTDNSIKNIYNINTKKTLKNITGDLLETKDSFDPKVMYKYGYIIFNDNNNNNNFINLKTGNISYTINGLINSFIEDLDENLVYITTYNPNNSKIIIYNSNGKKLFDGKEFEDIKLLSNKIVLLNNNKFYVYNKKLNLDSISKEYEQILEIYDDIAVVVDSGYLGIVNLNDELINAFDLKWDDNYVFNSELSGWKTENDKYGIYLSLENAGNKFKYYYIPETKEVGKIEG